MALLDVTDVLLYPDFMDSGLVCERTTQTVSSAGLAVNTTTNITFAGVVTSNSGDVMTRHDIGERVTGNITIHTMFELNDGGSLKIADVVQVFGTRYTVDVVNSYSHFGKGFVSVSCTIIPLAGS